MNLKSIRKDLSKLKEDMGKNDDPSLQVFMKWCEYHHYHRPVSIGELLFDEYSINNQRVKSDTVLFLKLSDKYFNQLHNSENPIKDNLEYGLKGMLSVNWFDKHKPQMSYNINEIANDDDYNTWFNNQWKKFIKTGDLSVFDDF